MPCYISVAPADGVRPRCRIPRAVQRSAPGGSMYDREAIRAPSVARYALGVAVACERRRCYHSKIPSKVDVWRCEGSKGDWDFGWGIPIPAKLFAHIGRPAQILIMKNPISFGTLPPSTLPKKRINRTRTDTRVCEKI